jgi:hypothetical protein
MDIYIFCQPTIIFTGKIIRKNTVTATMADANLPDLE